MTYDPDWDPRLDEIRRMPEVEISIGDDLVKAHTINSITFYVLKKDFTPYMTWFIQAQNPNAQYIEFERRNNVN